MSQLHSILADKIRTGFSDIRQAFRATLSAIDTKKPIQFAQLKGVYTEKLQEAELMQHFGMTSSPPEGTQCIIVPLGGKSVHGAIIATENENFRIVVERGETCIYNQWGARITFKKEKNIEIECDNFILNAKNSVQINTQKLHEYASTAAAYASPALSFEGTNGSIATAKMRANIEQEGYHTSTGDQVAGNISQQRHRHSCSECGQTENPISG